MTEYTKQTIRQTRGPRLKFNGKLLCETSWDARDGEMSMQVWETERGALIGVSTLDPDDDQGFVDVRAVVVEPNMPHAEPHPDWEPAQAAMNAVKVALDLQRMHFAILDFFGWNNRATAMVTKQAGWSIVQEIA